MEVNDTLKDIDRWRKNNKLSVFVGSGVSVLSGLPKWSDLIKLMLKEMPDLKYDENKLSSDDYLKIAQMYFNTFGEEKYKEKVKESFKEDRTPNKIHDLIFALHPNHILTTNYDNLLEQEAVKVGRNFSVINADNAVSSAPSSSYIVKVHGDFSSSNLVLKEQDYLDYEQNYKLIDKLVKTIFSTNLVIFIGYSLQDYNIKLILNWVKNVQADSFVKPVFIHIGDPLSELELDYQDKRGLRVLQTTDFGDLPNNYTDKYSKVLEPIIEYEDKKIPESFDEKMEYLADKVSGISHIRYLRSSDFNSVFESDYKINNGILMNVSLITKLVPFHQEHIYDYFETLFGFNSQKSYSAKEAIDAFLKSADLIRGNTCFQKEDVKEIKSAAYGSKISEMELYCSKDYTNQFDLFKKAYYLGILGRYEESYEIFNSLIVQFQKEKKWDLFYLAQINRKKLIQKVLKECKKFASSTEMAYDEFIQLIQTDNKSFYVEEQFSQLPVEFQNRFSFLSDFCNSNPFVEKNTELIKNINKADKDRVTGTITIGGMSKVESIKREMYENVKFVFENNLLISLFDEFKNYIKNCLFVWLESFASNLKKDSQNDQMLDFSIRYPFTYLDVILISETFTYDDMKYICGIVDFEMFPFDDEDVLKTYIKNQIEDFIKTFPLDSNIKGGKNVLFEQQVKKLRLLLTVSSYIIKDSEFVRYIIERMPYLRVRNFELDKMKPIIIRWVKNSNLDRQIAVNIIENWFISYIRELSTSIKENENTAYVDYNEFVSILRRLCDKNTALTHLTIDTIALLKSNLGCITALNPLYKHLNVDVKAYIDSHVPINSIIHLVERYDYEIPSNLNIDNVVENTFETILHNRKERERGAFAFGPYTDEDLMAFTIIAMLSKGISIQKYIGIDHHYDFWFNLERFDKKDFEINWVEYYPEKILDMIKNNEKRRSLVLEALDEDNEINNVEGYDLKRRYYVYRYLTKQ
ncbi:SIR2 family protein [Catenibacterium sp.]|uniref:SIR2 family protein n=3 Tax=Catenibacterium sp. TaxID=2049022 RepID=UPI003FD76AA2